MDELVQPSTPGLTRKKSKTPESWKRSKAKTARLVTSLAYFIVRTTRLNVSC